MILSELCQELNNWFDYGDRHYGTYTIENGTIEPLDFVQDGQYFRIIGSVFNDGVHQYPCDEMGLKDETFTGSIWAMSVPSAVLALAQDIEAYNESDVAKPSPYVSESFGGYSYTKATGADGGSNGNDWRNVFAKKLGKWRRL